MVVSGYSLHLYCDIDDCPHSRPTVKGSAAGEYFGETFTECAAQARRDGWYVNRKTRVALCKAHRGQKDEFE